MRVRPVAVRRGPERLEVPVRRREDEEPAARRIPAGLDDPLAPGGVADARRASDPGAIDTVRQAATAPGASALPFGYRTAPDAYAWRISAGS